jgi:hypothetical protein
MHLEDWQFGKKCTYKQTFITSFGGSRIIALANSNRIALFFAAGITADFVAGGSTFLPIGIFDTGVLIPVVNLTDENPNERVLMSDLGLLVQREWQFGTPGGIAAVVNLAITEVLITTEAP